MRSPYFINAKYDKINCMNHIYSFKIRGYGITNYIDFYFNENFIKYYIPNDFIFSNLQVIQEISEKTFDADVLYDGKNYAYRIYKNVPIERIYFYHCDHLMTPLFMTDEEGNTVWQAEYYPFGKIYSSSGEVENKLIFNLMLKEEGLYFYYNNQRYYFNMLGIFNNSKLYYYFAGSISDLYFYELNNPISYSTIETFSYIYCQDCIYQKGKKSGNSEIFAKIVCDGCNGFKWEWIKKPVCAEECFRKHEEAHIEWFNMNRPDACKGRPKGSNPYLYPLDKEKTECYAYRVSLPCLQTWILKSKMPGQSLKCSNFVNFNINYQKKLKEEYCKAAGETE